MNAPRNRLITANKWSAEFLSDFDVAANAQTPIEARAAAWADEFSAQHDTSVKLDYWSDLENQWDTMAKQTDNDWLQDFNTQPLYKEYQLQVCFPAVAILLQDANPYANVADALAEGRRLLSQGDLANAILHFEVAVARDATNSAAWRELGLAQSENEQEPMAIAALTRAVALDAGDLAAIFALSVAYINEYMYNHAMDALADWIRQHPHYAQFAPPADSNRHASSFMDT